MYLSKLEFYRATFMPIQGANSVRPLILGSFNYRAVPQEGVLDGLRTTSDSLRDKDQAHMNVRDLRQLPSD